MIELNSCWKFRWVLRNVILEESDEFCFLSSNEIFPSPMLILTDPEFYYTFSKYYLSISSTVSLSGITGFRQLKPIYSFENITSLSTQSGNKRKQHGKRGRGEGSCMPRARVWSRQGWSNLGRTNIHHGLEEQQCENGKQTSISVVFSVQIKGWEHCHQGRDNQGVVFFFFNILSLNKNWARLSSRLELAQQQRGATRAARMGSILHQGQSDMQNESVLHHTKGVLELITPQPMLSKT